MQPQVLGEQQIQESIMEEEEVEARLEAPYDEIERSGTNDLLPSKIRMQLEYSRNWPQE